MFYSVPTTGRTAPTEQHRLVLPLPQRKPKTKNLAEAGDPPTGPLETGSPWG